MDPTDNRLKNLRQASHHQNRGNRNVQKTSATGIKGVGFDKRRNLYTAYISPNGKRITLGQFATVEEAAAKRAEAANTYFGRVFEELGHDLEAARPSRS